jgi:hypothetical protein
MGGEIEGAARVLVGTGEARGRRGVVLRWRRRGRRMVGGYVTYVSE